MMTYLHLRTLMLRRRGFTLPELILGTLMLVVAMSVTVQSFGWWVHELREVERRELALQEAANLMERITALAWADLTPERAGACKLSEAARRALPGATLTVALDAPAEPRVARRIRVEVRWRDRSGRLQAPLRLTSWVYRHEGRKP